MGSLTIVNTGEIALLDDGLTGVAYDLRLYKTDVTAGLTPAQIDELDEGDFTESTFTGYASQALGTGDWTVTSGDPTQAVNVTKTFTRTATGGSENVWGYYVTRDSDGALIWFEQFDGPVVVEFEDDSVSVTPLVTLDDQFALGANMALQVFTSSGTWNKPDGLRAARVRLVGGGGGGGGAPTTTASQHSGGGPGGGATYAESLINAADLGATEAVTVAAGGAGGAAGANDGTTGGTSSFGSHVSAAGGTAGQGSAAVSSVTSRFAGTSTGSGTGDVVLAGSAGSPTVVIPGAGNTRSSVAGSSLLGGGARSLANANGTDGLGPGGGGSGGANSASQGTNRSGGAGADGIVIVEEFF